MLASNGERKADGAMSAVTVWLPKQYGSWAMLVAPAIAGGLLAGFPWPSWLLAGAWVVAYLGFMATRGVLAGRQRRQYSVAAGVYWVVAAVAIGVLLWWRLALLWWAIPLAVLLGTSLVMIATKRERSALNDACLIGASALMTAISATCWQLPDRPSWQGFAQAVNQPTAWLATAVMAAYFWGTIPYVKTLIRERGSRAWYTASVVYHGVLVVLAFLTMHVWLLVFACLTLTRAAVVPRRWPRVKPKYVGIGEIVGTVGIVLIVWLTLG